MPFGDCHFKVGSACNNLKYLPQQVISARGQQPLLLRKHWPLRK